jgi:hypothetical protein
MKRNVWSVMAVSVAALAWLTGCGGPADQPAGGGPEPSPIGRCAVDARDGAPYGRIIEATTDEATGETMFKIEGEGGAVWNKKAANVRVVDCP